MSSISREVKALIKHYDFFDTIVPDAFKIYLNSADEAVNHLKAQQHLFKGDSPAEVDYWNGLQDQIELIESFVKKGRKLLK